MSSLSSVVVIVLNVQVQIVQMNDNMVFQCCTKFIVGHANAHCSLVMVAESFNRTLG